MKIALHNPFLGEPVAETELARRLVLAAQRLGWQAQEVGTSRDIYAYDPDCVVSLHFRAPKLTAYPTYGCFWNPPAFFEVAPEFVNSVLSYDGYLCASPYLERWLQDTYYALPKPIFIAPFYPSCNQTPQRAADFAQARIAYVGSNWDGPRFQDLFLALEQALPLDVYGSGGWDYLQHSYRGSVPFDGQTLLDRLHQAGVGLCLHRPEHRQAEVASMRVFEIVAAGALAICSDHPFIRDAFGDTVLYLSDSLDPKTTPQQVAAHLAWVHQNPEAAQAQATAAHQIFQQRFALEPVLQGILPYHQRLIQRHQEAHAAPSAPRAEVVVRVGGRPLSTLSRALDSLVAQQYPNVGAVVVQYQPMDGLQDLLDRYRQRLPITWVDSQTRRCRSTQLWAGLSALSGEYFGILDDDDQLYPRHVASLVALLQRDPTCAVAYGGSNRIWEGAPSENRFAGNSEELGILAYFDDFDLDRFMTLENFIHSSSFLGRTALLNDGLCQDPQLDLLEDFFLLLNLRQRGYFRFSYEVTSAFYHRRSQQDNSIFQDPQRWAAAAQRVQRMMARQPFAVVQTPDQFLRLQAQVNQLTQDLHVARGRVAAMETSKFWRLRGRWFSLKRRLGLPTDNE